MALVQALAGGGHPLRHSHNELVIRFERRPLGNVDDIPIVEVEQLARRPLYVIAWNATLSSDMIGVDRRLVPVEMDEDVAKRSRSRGGKRFSDTARRKPAFALDYVHTWRIAGKGVCRCKCEPDGRRESDARCSCREPHERSRRSRMAVQGLRLEQSRERCRPRWISPEAE